MAFDTLPDAAYTDAMPTSRYTLSLALKISNSLLADLAQHDAMVKDCAREGFRPYTCEHGMSLHVDYDPICGPCEDGLTMRDGVQRREYALDSAKRRVAKVGEITTHIAALRDLGVHFTTEQLDPLYKRIGDLLTV